MKSLNAFPKNEQFISYPYVKLKLTSQMLSINALSSEEKPKKNYENVIQIFFKITTMTMTFPCTRFHPR